MDRKPPDPLFVIRGDLAPIHHLLFDNTSGEELLYIGTDDGTVQIWDLKICKKKKTIEIGESGCLSLHMVQEHLLTQDRKCTLKVWQPVRNFECILTQTFQENFSFCKISILHSEEIYLAIPQPESTVLIHSFSLANIRLLCSLKYNDKNVLLGDVMHLKLFSLTKNFVFVIYESGMLILWDLEGNMMLCDKIVSETPMAFDFDASNMQGICGTAEKNIVVFKIDDRMKITKRKMLQIANAGIGSLCVRSDSKILAAGCWDGKIRIFSWKTCKLLAVLESHRESILCVCFAHFSLSTWYCKHVLAVASSDKKISLWKIYDEV